MYDRRNGVGKPVFRLDTVGHERMFDVIAPGCVRLILLMMCWCSKHSGLRIARPMCDGRLFASSPFRRLASRGLSFLCGISFLWPLQVAIYLCRRQPLYDHVPQCWEINRIQCNRPYGTATCYFHTTIWLGRCQSMLTQVDSTSCCCFGNDSHQRDARHSRLFDDRRDAENCLLSLYCVVLPEFQTQGIIQKSTSVHWIQGQIHHSIWQRVD